jgi:mannitol/fructose-specific phosphotransferase system IIA component
MTGQESQNLNAGNQQVRVGMIGLGFGAEFLPIYQMHPNTTVAGICRRNEEELNKLNDLKKQLSDDELALLDAHILLAKTEKILEAREKGYWRG